MKHYNQIDNEGFIRRAKSVHGDKYDYSKVNYVNAKTKVCIICPEHGEFWQTPTNHLSGRGCPVCRYISSAKNNSLTTEEFIEKARKIHGDKYDYSKVVYVNQRIPVCIICHEKDKDGKEHGEFWQIPTGHIDKKAGCPRCSKNHRYTTDEFLNTLPEWIKEKYDFSKFVYKSTHEKSIVICREHGEFLQSPHNIRKGIGCPGCSESKLKRSVRLFLKEHNVDFVQEFKSGVDFGKQSIDFYLPNYNLGIECQGIQHFVPTDFAGKGKEWAESEFEHIQELDKNKRVLCKNKSIKLMYYTTITNFKLCNNKMGYENYIVITDIKELNTILGL